MYFFHITRIGPNLQFKYGSTKIVPQVPQTIEKVHTNILSPKTNGSQMPWSLFEENLHPTGQKHDSSRLIHHII